MPIEYQSVFYRDDEVSYRIRDVIESGLSGGLSGSGIKDILREQGLSYRVQNMNYDIRVGSAVYKIDPENVEGRERALDFYESKIEAYRQEYGLTASQAWKDFHQWENIADLTEEEAAEFLDRTGGFDFNPYGG